MSGEARPTDVEALLEYLFRLGQAYLACGEQTAQVELLLRRSAAAYGVRRSRVVTFPTAVFISLHDGAQERVTLAEGPTQTLRLDQIADVYELGAETQRGRVPPREGVERLGAILRKPPRFGALGIALGNTILAVGVAVVLLPTVANLAAAAVLGAIVGGLKVLNRERPILSAPLSVVAATLASFLAFSALRLGAPVEPLHALVPPLVAFLPGFMLTLGMVELAYGDMVSGSSRLLTGFIQLVLLAFGLAAGARIAGYLPESLVEAGPVAPVEWWAPWVGVFVFAVGVYVHSSAPRGSFGWLLVLVAAFAVQQASARVFGQAGSGFFGMLVATPLGYLVQLRFRGPPAMVTILPSFWLLVPGVLSLLSVNRMLSDSEAGLAGLVSALFAFVSLALGTLIGASLYKWLSESFGRWELQMGRVGRYFRSKKKKPGRGGA